MFTINLHKLAKSAMPVYLSSSYISFTEAVKTEDKYGFRTAAVLLSYIIACTAVAMQ
jgi:hypothetical protein